jgi:HK97 family phage major capsid protein
MPSPSSRAEYLALAEELTKRTNFTKEDSARVSALIAMAELTTPTIGEARLRTQLLREEMAPGQPSDREIRSFFAGANPKGPQFESPGSGLASMRTYAGLDTGTSGDAGGYTIPVGFHADVLQAMRAADGLFRAARWLFTTTGNVLNYPMSDDTSSLGDAAVLSESQAIGQGPNATFGNLQFPNASLWSTGQFLYSVQLSQDSGIDLGAYFAKIFGLKFARGCGKQFIATLLAGAATGLTTASPSAIVEGEVFDMVDSLDAAYAMAPTAGWLMNLNTLIAISKIRTSGGQVSFPMQIDDQGRPILLTRPVYISPSMDSIGASKKVAVFGDLDRFIVRSAMDSFRTLVYRERYMASHSLGTQAWWRLDGKLGLAGVSDAPVKVLVMHS